MDHQLTRFLIAASQWRHQRAPLFTSGPVSRYPLPAAMEVNRDEAERCIDIATAALSNDLPEKAQRFLEKAQRLFPTEKAKGELK